MTTTNYLICGVIIGVIVWATKEIVFYYINKKKIRYSTICDINDYLDNYKETKVFLDKLFEEHIKSDEEIKFKPNYIKDEFVFYKAFQKEFISYFSRNELIKVFKVYKTFDELECYIYGLINLITEYNKCHKKITDYEINFMKRKKKRIDNLIAIITKKEIKNIKDLPFDYRGRLTADTLIEK